jgi:tetratricopeptide (TPR) repeat protein
MAMGKFPEGIYDFTWAIKLETEIGKNSVSLSKFNRFAGQCYFEMSQYQEALTHFNQAFSKEESGINYFNRGLVRSKLN